MHILSKYAKSYASVCARSCSTLTGQRTSGGRYIQVFWHNRKFLMADTCYVLYNVLYYLIFRYFIYCFRHFPSASSWVKSLKIKFSCVTGRFTQAAPTTIPPERHQQVCSTYSFLFLAYARLHDCMTTSRLLAIYY